MGNRERMGTMRAFFEGVGTGDTAGVWEGAPNLRPDFRAAHQKKLDKAARAAKAEEMI
jgi:chlorophyllide a reductase subunit Y